MTHVFVVATGRSGTHTIAELLGSLPGCVVEHEREPKLLEEATAYLRGDLPHAELVELLRRTRSPDAIGGERLSGEANQRLSFVLPALAEAFPEARYVWLVRDGRDAVASMLHRRWYHPREAEVRAPAVRGWAQHRLQGDEVGDIPPEEWAGYDAFARCCWYWAYTNRLVARELERLGLRSFRLRLEELPVRLPDLGGFLELDPLPETVPHSNRASAGRPVGRRSWTPKQRATFARLCGAEMDALYPDWREEVKPSRVAAVLAVLGGQAAGARRAAAERTRPLRVRLGLARGVRDS